MASVQELIAAAEQIQRSRRSPLVDLVQNATAGFDRGRQDRAYNLDATMKLMEIDQKRRQEQEAQFWDDYAKQAAGLTSERESVVGQAHKSVAGPPTPVLPTMKLTGLTREGGRYAPKFESTTGGATYTPEQADAIASGDVNRVKKAFPGGVPKEALNAATSVQGRTASRDEAAAKEDEKRRNELMELQIPGFELSGEVRPTTKEAQDLRTGVASMTDFVKGVDRLSELIKKNGSTAFIGKEAGEMETLAANLKLTLKEVQKLGVLSASDIAFLEAQVFDPSQWKSLGTRTETALRQLETVKGRAQSGLSESLKTRGYRTKGGVAPSPSGSEERKSIGGKSYVKVNGEWFEE